MIKKGFTLIELLVVVAIIGILAIFVTTNVRAVQNKAYFAKAQKEFRSFEDAMYLYMIDHNNFPADVSRNIPPGLEEDLAGGTWPDAPWPGSVYDWDNITGADPYVQLSIRFCDVYGDNCNFPNEDWATDFDSSSSIYYCYEGNCRSHPNEPIDHPGYCINCEN